jgi:hypothetical protein
MANALYAEAKDQFLQATLDMDDSILWVGADHTDDTPVVATDDFLDDILAAARVPAAGSSAQAGKTYTDGVYDANDTVATSVSGDAFDSITLFNNTPGTEATKDLICFWDTATGLPTTPNGGDITVAWNASGIFAI